MIKFFTKQLNNKKGFTLIELIVVIAILGILAALAIPRLAGTRDNANRKAVEANLRTIDSAISIALASEDSIGFAETATTGVNLGLLVTNDYLATSPTKPNETYEVIYYGTSPDEQWRAVVSIPENTYGTHGVITAKTVEDLGW